MEGPLRPEDGARFIATIERLEEGCRGSYVIRLDAKSEILEQLGDKQLFVSEAEAKKWLHAEAAARGFAKVEIEARD